MRRLPVAPTQRTERPQRDGTTQGKGTNDESYDLESQQILKDNRSDIIRTPALLPPAYSAPRTQARIRVVQEQHRRRA